MTAPQRPDDAPTELERPAADVTVVTHTGRVGVPDAALDDDEASFLDWMQNDALDEATLEDDDSGQTDDESEPSHPRPQNPDPPA